MSGDTERQNNSGVNFDYRNVYWRPHKAVSCTETRCIYSTTEFDRYFESFDSRTITDADVAINNRTGTETGGNWYSILYLFR